MAIVANFSDLKKGIYLARLILRLILRRIKTKEHDILPVSCIFGVYDFGQNKIHKSLSFSERSTLWNRWPEDGHFFAPGHRHTVLRIVGARIYGSHNDKYVLKLGAYPSRTEW